MGHKWATNCQWHFSNKQQFFPKYLFLKPAQGGLSQLSCFIVFFSVGLTQRDNIYQHLSCGRTYSTRGCTLARCLHVRTTSTCARPHPRKLPKRGILCSKLYLPFNHRFDASSPYLMSYIICELLLNSESAIKVRIFHCSLIPSLRLSCGERLQVCQS